MAARRVAAACALTGCRMSGPARVSHERPSVARARRTEPVRALEAPHERYVRGEDAQPESGEVAGAKHARLAQTHCAAEEWNMLRAANSDESCLARSPRPAHPSEVPTHAGARRKLSRGPCRSRCALRCRSTLSGTARARRRRRRRPRVHTRAAPRARAARATSGTPCSRSASAAGSAGSRRSTRPSREATRRARAQPAASEASNMVGGTTHGKGGPITGGAARGDIVHPTYRRHVDRG